MRKNKKEVEDPKMAPFKAHDPHPPGTVCDSVPSSD